MQKNVLPTIAAVALIAFLLNALLPFFAVYNLPSPPSVKQADALFGEKILICTGDGFKWVTWKELLKERRHQSASHYKCPLCYLAAHGLKDFTQPPAIAFNATISGGSASIMHSGAFFRPTAVWSPFASRAPPISVVSI